MEELCTSEQAGIQQHPPPKLGTCFFGEVQAFTFLIDPQLLSFVFIELQFIHPSYYLLQAYVEAFHRSSCLGEVGLGVTFLLVAPHSKHLSLPTSSSFEHLFLGHFSPAGFISDQGQLWKKTAGRGVVGVIQQTVKGLCTFFPSVNSPLLVQPPCQNYKTSMKLGILYCFHNMSFFRCKATKYRHQTKNNLTLPPSFSHHFSFLRLNQTWVHCTNLC